MSYVPIYQSSESQKYNISLVRSCLCQNEQCFHQALVQVPKLILTDGWDFSVWNFYSISKSTNIYYHQEKLLSVTAKIFYLFFFLFILIYGFKCIFLHVKSLSTLKTKKMYDRLQVTRKPVVIKEFLHMSILIAIENLSGGAVFTGLKHFYILTFSHLLKKMGFWK